MIVLLDNRDSFVHNLARYVRELGEEAVVLRSDACTVESVESLRPSHVIISPGPGGPRDAGISVAAVRRLGASTPILGVCLGHQCIGVAYGARVRRALRPMHGKTSRVEHDGTGLFEGIPSGFVAARYHSLVIDPSDLPACLVANARAEDGEIMAIRHRSQRVAGVQFHPESVLSEYGYLLLDRFLRPSGPRGESLPRGADLADGVPTWSPSDRGR